MFSENVPNDQDPEVGSARDPNLRTKTEKDLNQRIKIVKRTRKTIKKIKIKKKIRNPIKKINQRKKVSNMLHLNCPFKHLSHTNEKF